MNQCKGCNLCKQGKKSVLFITGLCARNCFFCPVSETKKNHDDVYINEWKTDKVDEIIKEIELCSSSGVGITGGDPLVKIARTVSIIKTLKEHFGERFHIHMYVPTTHIKKKDLQLLYEAGLDEIRVHPSLDTMREWKRIDLCNEFDWDLGIEIPVIPGMETNTKKLMEYCDNKIKFMNLNELEISEPNIDLFKKKKFLPINELSYAVKGSKEMGRRLIEFANQKQLSYNVHFCSALFKDSVQLKKRIKRRARNVREFYDRITEDGTLVRGCVYLKDTVPSFGYHRGLKTSSDKEHAERLVKMEKELFGLGISKMKVDLKKKRILLPRKQVEKKAKKIKKLGYVPAVVEEYPTYDQIEVEVDIL